MTAACKCFNTKVSCIQCAGTQAEFDAFDFGDAVNAWRAQFLHKRAKIVEIVACQGVIFALAQSGACAAFDRGVAQRDHAGTQRAVPAPHDLCNIFLSTVRPAFVGPWFVIVALGVFPVALTCHQCH